ncbi:MAG: BlaI/MecI/CopY family transcriptional regulator [Bacteroidales bacterium]|nr:BlaI/MecI/CopY family transcriptional regulator [Bacteroidales bacterium]
MKLTPKEEEIMNLFWKENELYVKELLNFYDDPKPHFNTLSTIVRGLEEKGFLSHKANGNSYKYFPIIDKEEFKKGTLKDVVKKYFNCSFLNVVSTLVKEEDISIEDLKKLIDEVEKQ